MKKKLSIIGYIVAFIIYTIIITHREVKIVRIVDTPTVYIISQPSFKDKSPEEGLKEALEYYGIKCPSIVYAQAVLETGHFKSAVCTNNNNLFGLYDNKNGKYYRFKHWSESVVAYKSYIQNRYKTDSSYYQFLKSIGYAEDPAYIRKIKQIEE